MKFKKIALGTLAFFISSFVIQGVLGFVLAQEYFESIPFLRSKPITYLAFTQTIIAGIAFTSLYPLTNLTGSPLKKGLKFGAFISAIIVSFIALDIPARFTIPEKSSWIITQGFLGLAHYLVAGVIVSFIYKAKSNQHNHKEII